MLQFLNETLLFDAKIDVCVRLMHMVMCDTDSGNGRVIICECDAQPTVTRKAIHLHSHPLLLRVLYKSLFGLLPAELSTEEDEGLSCCAGLATTFVSIKHA